MAIVYKHIRKDNNEVFYIGIGTSSKRAYSIDGRNNYWHHIADKHGYDVVVTHIDIIWEEACAIEKYLISFYGRKDLNEGTLVNMTDGGDGTNNVIIKQETRDKLSRAFKGRIFSEEHRRKLSERQKGKNAYWYGKKVSEETCRKKSESLKGKKRSDESKLKYSQSKTGDKNPMKREDIRKRVSKKLKGKKYPNRVVINKKKHNIIECPFCGYMGDNISGGMTRWHFNNCKSIKNKD